MVKCDEPSASEIIPGLWLGDENSAMDINFINKYNIKNIIRFIKGDPPIKKGVTVLHMPWDDKELCGTDTKDMFNRSMDFIMDSLNKNEGILVHCRRGHHRSASIVVAFLVESLNMDLEKVINYIRNKRKCALRRLSCMVQNYIHYHLVKNR